MNEHIYFAGDVLIAAAAERKGPRRFAGTLYNGGPLKLPNFPAPVVVDLSGLEGLEKPWPVSRDHNDERLVGHMDEYATDGAKLDVGGAISATGADAADVLAMHDAGFPWQMSIEAMPAKEDIEVVHAGQAVTVNKQTFQGPVLVARKARLIGASVVPRGADLSTSFSIAAKRGIEMSASAQNDGTVNAQTTPATIQASPERKRLEAIEATFAGLDLTDQHLQADAAELRIRAMAGEIDTAQLNAALLGIVRSDRKLAELYGQLPKAPAAHTSNRDPMNTDTMAAGLMVKAGFCAAAERQFGERVLNAVDRNRASRKHLLDLAKQCLTIDGRECPASRDEMVKAAFSTVSMPAALGLAGEKVLLDAYRQAPATWREWCKVVSVASFREHTLLRPSFLGGFHQVSPAGEIKHAHVSEETATIKADTFAKLLSITRADLINDDAGAFGQAAASMGKAAARKLADLVIEVLLGGIGGGFFSEGNGNLLDDPLSLEAVAAAVALLRAQVDADGDSLDIVPRVLLVGPALESAARAICESEFIQASEGTPTGNSMKGVLTPVVEPRLSNPSITGASATTWAVLAGPADVPQAVAFLNGAENPTIEELGLQAEVDKLAFTWRAFHDFGSSLIDFRAAVLSTGDGDGD